MPAIQVGTTIRQVGHARSTPLAPTIRVVPTYSVCRASALCLLLRAVDVDEGPISYNCKWQFIAIPDNRRVRLILDGMTDIDTDYENIPIHVDTLLAVAPLPMARLSEQECVDLYQRLGFEDPVEFRKDGTRSTLVFLNQGVCVGPWSAEIGRAKTGG